MDSTSSRKGGQQTAAVSSDAAAVSSDAAAVSSDTASGEVRRGRSGAAAATPPKTRSPSLSPDLSQQAMEPIRQVSGTFESSPSLLKALPSTPSRLSSKDIDAATKTRHPRGILRQSSGRAGASGDPAAARAALLRSGAHPETAVNNASHPISMARAPSITAVSPPRSPLTSTTPPPCVPTKPDALFPRMEVVMSATEAHKVINALAARLERCDHILGSPPTTNLLDGLPLPKSSGSSSTSGELKASTAELDSAALVDGGGEGSVVDDWRNELRSAMQPAPLAVQLRHVRKFTDSFFAGRISEFEKKYNFLQAWLESEHATISQLVLNLHAKRTYILEHERMLRQVAEQLKRFEELKQYVNPPNLQDIADSRSRLLELERKGHEMSEKAYKLDEAMRNLAWTHCTAMNAVFEILGEWSERMGKAKLVAAAAAGALEDPSKGASARKRKTVLFADSEIPDFSAAAANAVR